MKSEKDFYKIAIRFLIFTLTINSLCLPMYALDLDMSLDEDIRKNYNPNKIDEDMGLPTLPRIMNENIDTVDKKPSKSQSQSQSHSLKPVSNYPARQIVYKKDLSAQNSYVTLKKGTKFKAKLLNNVSDNSRKGTRLTFITIYPVSTTYFTIPSGTTLQGAVVNSRRPWLSGNGGLIEIKLNSIILNNENQPINAFVTDANNKIIFFNNIKGKRKYLISMFRSMRPGSHFCRKMLGLSFDLARDGSSIIVAPFSLASGVIAFGGNILVSPALALFYKGDHISLKSGSLFEFKLAQDVFIYN